MRIEVTFPPEVVEQLVDVVVERVLDELRERDPGGWPQWMSADTASRYLDVSVERVRKLIARREIPFVQEAPGCRVFLGRHDLDAWMEKMRS